MIHMKIQIQKDKTHVKGESERQGRAGFVLKKGGCSVLYSFASEKERRVAFQGRWICLNPFYILNH